ncbi:DUF305 domain-containing protein [Micromonospora polyrhachis]|uniref:Uncharacterized protein (DUF305 family) n=1 Tax=Micromonospora polyrhachis TaxID=1282883 RepID=A0A7W7SRC7_9ACTN|nr:DUF305 domain-containing protein [Micromonospora polyrhachis]MBB4958290.1 uncharacterized protein (DUF305 family) [Micromonospora polyrhachis]
MTRYRRSLLAASLLLLTGCGSATAPTPPTSTPPEASPAPTAVVSAIGEFNAADVMFLQMMVTHHEQGIELVRLAETRAQRPELKILAAAIDVTQSAERDTMQGWLRDWGRPTSADPNAHAHADHGGMPATGPEEIAALRQLSGAEFDRTFLNLMTGHQHGAVELARTEIRLGVHQQSRELARRIDLSRTAQIDQMLELLA